VSARDAASLPDGRSPLTGRSTIQSRTKPHKRSDIRGQAPRPVNERSARRSRINSDHFRRYRSLRKWHCADSIGDLPRQTPDIPEPLGSLIRRLRVKRGWSQEALAFEVRLRSDVSPTAGAIGQIERGVTRPRMATIEGIARALDLSPKDLAEYRLAAVRRLFDDRAVGLDQALANLEVFEQAFTYPLKAPAPGPQQHGVRARHPKLRPRR
jgi:transcriptional regulator with XRE-family HTH domain